MAIAPHRTIVLKGRDMRYEEGRAGGAITPGHLIMLTSAGDYTVDGTAGATDELTVAIEDSLRGKTIDDAYADDDLIRFVILRPGDVFLALLPASATAVVIGDNLIRNGDGCLKKTTGSPTQVVAVALEAVDNSAGGTVARIKCRVIGG